MIKLERKDIWVTLGESHLPHVAHRLTIGDSTFLPNVLNNITISLDFRRAQWLKNHGVNFRYYLAYNPRTELDIVEIACQVPTDNEKVLIDYILRFKK